MPIAEEIAARLKRSPDGLVCAVVQESGTGRVLMVAWMNDDALAETLETRRGVYWSRSRGKLWRKGDESGHKNEQEDPALRANTHGSPFSSCHASSVRWALGHVG